MSRPGVLPVLRRRWLRLGLVLVLLAALGGALALTAGKPLLRRVVARLTPPAPEFVLTGTEITLGGRSYLAWLPQDPAGAPVLLVLHGASRQAERFAQATGLAAATARGYAVLAPLGTSRRPGGSRSWNAGHCCSFAFLQKTDEPAFLDAVLADAGARWGVDAARPYVAGFSAGGMTALRYALTRPGRVRAVASVSGMPDPALMPPEHPVPALLIHGTRDEVMPFAGGFVGDEEVGPGGGYVMSGAEETADAWGRAMGLATVGQRKINPRLNLAYVTERDWIAPDGSVSLRLMIVGGGRHAWPGGAEAPKAEIRATEEVLRFFAGLGGPAASGEPAAGNPAASPAG